MTRFSPCRNVLLSLSAAALVMAPSLAVAKPAKGKAKPAMTASATLVSPAGAARGWARVSETKDGLAVTVRGEGLAPGEHGLHIHTTGACTAPDFASAGGHWNPMQKQHGMENPAGPHEGDLPNLSIGADGKGEVSFVVKGGKLKAGDNALLDTDGAAMVVHAGPDDMKTDPSGNSGGRIACGVFAAS